MMSREDCEKWLDNIGYDEKIRLYRNGVVLMLHEFSKSSVGHSWVDQGFRAEEEKQKASP